jgi:hypothetical protein
MAEALLSDDRIEVLRASPDDPVSLRLEEWVQRWVDDAVDDLFRLGEATVKTSGGVLYLRMKRPSRLRDGALWIANTPDMHNAGYSRLSLGGDMDLRSVVSFYVSNAVVGLVGE